MENDNVPQKGVPENQQLYFKYREELYKGSLSNAENLDKTLISLSTFGLMLSVTLIDKLIPLSKAHTIGLLLSSWIGFIASIACVLGSYYLSRKAFETQLESAKKHYIDKEFDSLNKENIFYSRCVRLTNIASILFVCSLVVMAFFVAINSIGG